VRVLKTTQTFYPYLSKGGPPAKVRGIARALARRGHKVTVLTTDLGAPSDRDANDWQPANGEWGREWNHDGVNAIYLAAIAKYRATTINRRLLDFCRQRVPEFDLVHIYGLYDLIGPVVARFCRRRGVPFVVESLGMFQPKVRSLKKKRLYHALVGDSLLRDAAAIIATSETERAELIDGGVPNEKIALRRNGLDLKDFERLPLRGALRSKLRIEEKERLVLFLGRLSFIKGLDNLVLAFSEISGKQNSVRLVIAGPDDGDGCLQRIQELARNEKLGDRVIVSEALYGERKLEALVDADLCVLPSRYESFGNAAAEAIACGIPVLVTDTCGIAPMISDRAGLVVPATAAGLRDGLGTLLNNSSLLARLRQGCREVADELSWDKPVDLMEAIYRSLIAKGTVWQQERIARRGIA